MSLPSPEEARPTSHHTYDHTTPQGQIPFSRPAIVGATGHLGKFVLNGLLEKFHATYITIIVRESTEVPTKEPFLVDLKIVRVPDYADRDAMTEALKGCDVLISTLNHTAIHIEHLLVKACIDAGVKRYMPSEYTLDVIDTKYRADGSKLAVSQKRIDWADELHNMAVKEGSIEYTTIVPAGFIDYCLSTSFWGFDSKTKQVPEKIGTSTNTRTGCSLSFVATCLATSLTMPSHVTANKRIRIAEVEYTGQSILDILNSLSDDQWTVTSEEAIEEDPYLAFVVESNFNSSSYGYLPDGLAWNSTGEYAVKRRSLKEILEEEVVKPKKEEVDVVG